MLWNLKLRILNMVYSFFMFWVFCVLFYIYILDSQQVLVQIFENNINYWDINNFFVESLDLKY